MEEEGVPKWKCGICGREGQGRIQDFGRVGGLISIFTSGGWYRRGLAPPVTARGEASADFLTSAFI